MDFSFTRYLAAKRTVDDRALNQHVWQCLQRHLPAAAPGAPLRILEVGAGIGTMVERLLDWLGLTAAAITTVDAMPENAAAARQRLARWATERGLNSAGTGADQLTLRDAARHITVDLWTDDLYAFASRQRGRAAWDLLVAHAVLDLLDLPAALPALAGLVRPGGLLYLTINFDGVTILEPPVDSALDDQIMALYHRTMDERRIGDRAAGDSRTGRRLFGELRHLGVEILAAGASDWVVLAGSDGYPADEAYFLHCIVDMMRGALAGRPDLDEQRFAAWVAERHAQIERGELVYIAHQLDLLARVPTQPVA